MVDPSGVNERNDKSRFFGGVRQNGYVVRDIHAAMSQWTEVLGVEPFYFVEQVPVVDFEYRGVPSDVEISVALANTGDLHRALDNGFEIGQQGRIGDPGRFVYFDTESPAGSHPGTVVELSDISGPKGRFFDHVREKASSWDGRHPIRPAGDPSGTDC